MKEVKSFIGLVKYYNRNLNGLVLIARPLTVLIRKDKNTGKFVAFSWGEECETAFTQIKQLLTSAPLLHPPDLYLWTDTSSIEDLVPYLNRKDASRQTNLVEQKYAPTELEVAALIFAVESLKLI